jgi:thiol-disulfide isomerase/thioredoxin
VNKRAFVATVLGSVALLTSLIAIHGVSSPPNAEASVVRTQTASTHEQATPTASTPASKPSLPSAPAVERSDDSTSGSTHLGTIVAYNNLHTIQDKVFYLVFFSPICHACQTLAPKFTQYLAITQQTEIPIYQVDVSTISQGEISQLMSTYGIQGIPAVFKITNGQREHLDLAQIYSTIQFQSERGKG